MEKLSVSLLFIISNTDVSIVQNNIVKTNNLVFSILITCNPVVWEIGNRNFVGNNKFVNNKKSYDFSFIKHLI